MFICRRALIFAGLLIVIAIVSRIGWIDKYTALAMMAALTVHYAVRGRNRSCSIGG